MNFDALDEIRMDCLCHIRFVTHSLDPVPHPTFEVMGNNIDRIRDACGRLNGIIDQQDARQFGRPRWYLVKPCDTSELRATIKLEDYLSPKLLQRGQQESSPTTSVLAAVPRFSGPILTQGELEEREYRSEMIQVPGVCTGGSDVERLNLESLEATTMTTLEILTHYRGYLRMRASLGKFGLTSYPKGADGKPKIEYELDDFDNMLSTANRQESRMEGHVTKE